MVKKFQNYNGCVSIFGMLDVGQKLTLERHSYRALSPFGLFFKEVSRKLKVFKQFYT